MNVRVRTLAHRIVQRAAGRVGHHEAGRLLQARSVQADHVRVAHAGERAHLATNGLVGVGVMNGVWARVPVGVGFWFWFGFAFGLLGLG